MKTAASVVLKEPVQWGGALALQPTVILNPTEKSTPSGRALSVLFDDLRISLQAPEEGMSAVKIACIEIPMTLLGEGGFVGYCVQIRGFVSKGSGSRATLVAEMGNGREVLPFPYDRAHEGEFLSETFSLERRGEKGSEVDIPPIPPFTLNLMISAQRRLPREALLIVIESIDIQAVEVASSVRCADSEASSNG